MYQQEGMNVMSKYTFVGLLAGLLALAALAGAGAVGHAVGYWSCVKYMNSVLENRLKQAFE